jgi:hypothetical protein
LQGVLSDLAFAQNGSKNNLELRSSGIKSAFDRIYDKTLLFHDCLE